MEPTPQDCARELVFAEKARSPLGCEPNWKEKKKLRNARVRDHAEKVDERQQSSASVSTPFRFNDVQKLEAFNSFSQDDLLLKKKGDFAGGSCSNSRERMSGESPTTEQNDKGNVSCLCKSPVSTKKPQPQVFSLSLDLTRGDALTERATRSLDIYELDWHTLDFKCFLGGNDLFRQSREVTLASGSLEEKLTQQESVYKEVSEQLAGQNPLKRCLLDAQRASLTTPISPVCEQTSKRQQHDKRPASTTLPLTARNVSSRCCCTPVKPGIQKAVSLGNLNPFRTAASRELQRFKLRTKQADTPAKSDGNPSKLRDPGADSFTYTNTSGVDRTPVLPISACILWSFFPACLAFSWLQTVNCSGTPLKSAALHAFAVLAHLKHLVLANCKLQDLSFLVSFVKAVPLQSLIVPFNQIRSLPKLNNTQFEASSTHVGKKAGYTPTVAQKERNFLQNDYPHGTVQGGLTGVSAGKNKHPETTCFEKNYSRLLGRDHADGRQCQQAENTNDRTQQVEWMAAHISVSVEQREDHQENVRSGNARRRAQSLSFLGEKSAENGHGAKAVEEGLHRIRRAKNGPLKKLDLDKRRNDLLNVTPNCDAGRGEVLEKRSVFPMSLRSVDLSCNFLSDARELLFFGSNFVGLRTVRVCGNLLHSESPTLLLQIKGIFESKPVNFECDYQRQKEEDTSILSMTPPATCFFHWPTLTAVSEKTVFTEGSAFSKRQLFKRQAGAKSACSWTANPSSADELQRLKRLVDRLAQEKAKLANELDEARQGAQGEGGRSFVHSKKEKDLPEEPDIKSLTDACEKDSCLGSHLHNQGPDSPMWPGGEENEEYSKNITFHPLPPRNGPLVDATTTKV